MELWVVCFCGLGSGTLLSLTTRKALDKLKVRGNVTVYGSTDMPAGGKLPDLVMTQPELYNHFKSRAEYKQLFESNPPRIAVVTNYTDVDKVVEVLKPIIEAARARGEL